MDYHGIPFVSLCVPSSKRVSRENNRIDAHTPLIYSYPILDNTLIFIKHSFFDYTLYLYPTFFSFYTYIFIILCLGLSFSYHYHMFPYCFLICFYMDPYYIILLLAYAFYPYVLLLYHSDPSLILYCLLYYPYVSLYGLLNVSDVFPYYILLYVIYLVLCVGTDISYGIPANCLLAFYQLFPIVFL